MSNSDPTKPTDKAGLTFPSLEDSPLWADDYAPPAEAKQEETPPLFIIRAQYPRVAKAIELMWGSKEMDTYFNRLVVNERGDRAGFPRDVMAAILKLSADHAKRFKFDQQEAMSDSWGSDRYYRHVNKE